MRRTLKSPSAITLTASLCLFAFALQLLRFFADLPAVRLGRRLRCSAKHQSRRPNKGGPSAGRLISIHRLRVVVYGITPAMLILLERSLPSLVEPRGLEPLTS